MSSRGANEARALRCARRTPQRCRCGVSELVLCPEHPPGQGVGVGRVCAAGLSRRVSDYLVAAAVDVLINTDRPEAEELPELIWVVVEPFA